MACTLMGELERSEYVVSQDVPTFSITYLVSSSTGTDTEIDALATVPNAMYSQLGAGIESYVTSRTCKMSAKDKRNFICVVSWGKVNQQEIAPWLMPAIKGYDASQASVNVIKDISNNLIMNSANDPFKGIDVDSPRTTYTIKKSYQPSTFNLALCLSYNNAINSSSWNSGATATWKVKSIKVQQNWSAKWGYWDDVDIQIDYNPLTWDVIVLDEGLKHIVAGKKIPIKKGASDVTEPWALNGSGVALAEGSTSFVYKTFQVYNRLTFTVFDIT